MKTRTKIMWAIILALGVIGLASLFFVPEADRGEVAKEIVELELEVLDQLDDDDDFVGEHLGK